MFLPQVASAIKLEPVHKNIFLWTGSELIENNYLEMISGMFYCQASSPDFVLLRHQLSFRLNLRIGISKFMDIKR